MDAEKPVGFFDSGVGGISVLGRAWTLLPKERWIFYGDNGNAPYGDKSEVEIRALTGRAVERLMARGIKALVLACNTATSAAADQLRAALTIPVIGMEPALKPASTYRREGQVLVLATRRTLELPKFRGLMAQYGQGAVPVPCPGLVECVERGDLTGPTPMARLESLLAPFAGRKVDAVVLGCTHFVFLRESIATFFPPETLIVDGNDGTARQLARVLERDGLLGTQGNGIVEWMSSGDEAKTLPLMRRLLDGCAQGGVNPCGLSGRAGL